MTVTNSKFENDLTPISRIQIKRNGIVIRAFKSSSGHTYHVTIFEGRVSSCERTDGTPCPSWHFNRKCHHATLALQLEAERDTEELRFNPWHGSNYGAERPIDERGTLNGSCGGHGFSLLK